VPKQALGKITHDIRNSYSDCIPVGKTTSTNIFCVTVWLMSRTTHASLKRTQGEFSRWRACKGSWNKLRLASHFMGCESQIF